MGVNSSDFSCYETGWVYALLLSLPIRSGRKSINIWLLFPMEILNAFCVDHVPAPLHITTHLQFLPQIAQASPDPANIARVSLRRVLQNLSPAQDLSPPHIVPSTYSIGTERRAPRPSSPERVQNTLPHSPHYAYSRTGWRRLSPSQAIH